MPTLNENPAVAGFQKYFNNHSRYSPFRADKRTSGSKRWTLNTLQVSFVVNSDGKVENVKFDDLNEEQKKSNERCGITGKDLEAVQSEIERLLLETAWTPGRQDEKDVTVLMRIKVGFILLEHEMTGNHEDIFTIVEDMPLFDGKPAETGFRDYVTKNVTYPKEAQEKEISGMVLVEFVIDTDGSLVDAKVVRSVDPLLDAEALRVISSSPKWTPGKQRGKIVNVKYTFPVRFRLNN
jgi:TonB family protein